MPIDASQTRFGNDFVGDANANANAKIPDGDFPYLTIAVFVCILVIPIAFSGCHWDGRDIVTVSTTDEYIATTFDNLATLALPVRADAVESGRNAPQLGEARGK